MDPFDQLRLSIYDATLRPSRQPALAEELARATGADVAVFHVQDLAAPAIESALPCAVDEIDPPKRRAPHGPRARQQGPRNRSGTPSRQGELQAQPADVSRPPCYHEFAQAFGMPHTLDACILREPSRLSMLSLLRSEQQREFDAETTQLVARLPPHLQRSILVQRALRRTELAEQAAWEALQNSCAALVAFDRWGMPELVTRAARRVLARHDGLVLTRNGLRALDSSADSRLLRVLTLARAGAIPAEPLVGVPRRSGPDYRVLVVGAITSAEFAGPAALALIGDPESTAAPPADLLAEIYGLTTAEGTLASALAIGMPLAECARRRGVSLETVRCQAKRIYAKVGVDSQLALAHRLGALAELDAP